MHMHVEVLVLPVAPSKIYPVHNEITFAATPMQEL